MKKSRTIVFVHGMFVNNTSWSEWKKYFEALGYTVHTPANPGHEGDPSQLRKSTHPDLTRTGFEDVVMNVVKLIDTLPEKPIVVGHSMAGLVVQKLVEMDKAVAGVSINGAPPKNILAPLSTVRIVWPAINFFKGNSAYMGSREWYRKAFFNTISEKESDVAFDAIAVPESRKIGRDTVLKSFSNVDFSKQHAPLLFIAGGKDNIFSPSLTKRISKGYKPAGGRVDYKEFTEKSHFIAGEPGWQEVAKYVEGWIQSLD
jgi:pimeloyl-ACP methyl ester carboxylesterase